MAPAPLPARVAAHRRRGDHVQPDDDPDHSVSLPGNKDRHAVDEDRTGRDQPGGVNSWRAGCVGTRTSGSEGGPGKRASRKADTAPRSDPTTGRSMCWRRWAPVFIWLTRWATIGATGGS